MTPKKPQKVKFQIFKMAHVCTIKVWSVTGWPIISNIILQKKIGVAHIKAKNQHLAQLVKF